VLKKLFLSDGSCLDARLTNEQKNRRILREAALTQFAHLTRPFAFALAMLAAVPAVAEPLSPEADAA
jgi:hypothetical protein